MKVTAVLLAVGLAGTAGAGAQQGAVPPVVNHSVSSAPGTGAQGQGSTVLTMTLSPCPVSIQAKHGPGSGMLVVRDPGGKRAPDDAQTQPSQHIHLILGTKEAPGAVGATVTARGFSARARMDNTAQQSVSDLRRTLDVSFAPEKDGAVAAEIVLPGFTAVTSIKLEALRFADGRTVDLAGRQTCVVTPDPFMLVAGK